MVEGARLEIAYSVIPGRGFESHLLRQICMLSPTPEETARRNSVIEAILDHIRREQRIKLPEFDGTQPPSRFALQTVGIEPNLFGGTVGPFRYQFEGEDDLLHVLVVRIDDARLTAEDAQHVVRFLLPDLPPALIWLKPGEFSQHFYFGHDELL